MDIFENTKEEVLCEIDRVDFNEKSPYHTYMLTQLEYLIEQHHINNVRKRQETLNLNKDSLGYLAYMNGELTPGCKACLSNRLKYIRTTTECTRNCKFCYHYKTETVKLTKDQYRTSNDRFFDERDIKLIILSNRDKLDSVGWLYYEPLMEIDKMLGIMKFASDLKLHQFIYTNGDLANEKNLKKLEDAGLNEIRFNLAASNCSDRVIKHMKMARKMFEYVCIESPMFKSFVDTFIGKREEILDTGFDHFHCAELQLRPNTVKEWVHEGSYYRYREGYVSPIVSRNLTYDLFNLATKEKWDVVMHDCSNEVKFYRGVMQTNNGSMYRATSINSIPLDKNWYKDVAIKYLKKK